MSVQFQSASRAEIGLRLRVHGWIFGPFNDAVVFLGPVVLAALLVLSGLSSASWWILAVAIFDHGHLGSTGLPLVHLRSVRMRRVVIASLLFICGISIGLQLVPGPGLMILQRFLTYMTILHHSRQYYGLLKRSQWTGGLALRSFLARAESLLLALLVIYSYLYWHVHSELLGATFVFPGDLLIFSAPDWLVGALGWGVKAGFLAWIAWLGLGFLRDGSLRAGSISVMVSAFVIFYGGIVFLHSREFFVVALVLAHALQYHVWIVHSGASLGFYNRSVSSYLVFVILGIGGCLYAIERSQVFGQVGVNAFVATALLMHYVWDAVLWRKNARLLRNEMSVQPA